MKLTDKFEEYLKDIHAKQYMGTDDNLPDDFNTWLEKIQGTEMMRKIKSFYEDYQEVQAMHEEEEKRELQTNKY